MELRHLGALATGRSPGEPDSGLFSGTGEHTVTMTVCGSPDTEVPLAERGFIIALLDCARTHGTDLSSLDPLRHVSGSIAGAELAAMLHQLGCLLDALGTNPGWGLLAWSSHQPRTYARALIPTVEPTVLLATPTAGVAVGRDGLRLRLRGITVTGWHPEAARIVLHTAGGEYSLRTSTITAALLQRLAHGHTHAALVRRSIADLATPLLAGLQTAASITDCARPLLLGSQPPVPIPGRVNDEPPTGCAR